MEEHASTGLRSRAAAAFKAVVADPEAAAPDVAELVVATRTGGDAAALAAALRAAGWLERCRLHHDEAERILDESVRVARRHGLAREWRDALTSRGAVRHERGRTAAAQRDFDQAALLVGDAADLELDSQRAALLQNTGRLAEAARLYRRILDQPDGDVDVRTKAAYNLGLLEVWCGRPAAGLAWFELAAATAADVGPAAAAFVLASRAWATVRAGDLSAGLALYDEAAGAWSRLGIPLAELYAEYADALADLRLIPEAHREARRAVASLDEHGFALIAAEAELRLARLTLLLGDAVGAAERAALVASRMRVQGRAAWVGQARLVAVEARLATGAAAAGDLADARRAAAALERAGFVAEAVEAHLAAGRVAIVLRRRRTAVDELRRADQLAAGAPLLTRLKGHVAGALASSTSGETSTAIRRARAGLADLARHRAALPSMELRTLASGHGAELGRIGLAAVARHRRPAAVLAWMERTRAAALGSVDAPDVAGIEDELGALRVVQGELAAARREGSVAVNALLARQASIEDGIRRATWRSGRAVGRTDRPWTIGALRGLLDDEVLVEYDVLDGAVIAAIVERSRTRVVELGPMAAAVQELTDLRFALRRLAQGTASAASLDAALQSAEACVDALVDQLVAPLRLPAHHGVVVVPVGDLQRMPWTALHDVPVSVAPSAALWARTRLRPPSAAGDGVALVAGPELPGAAGEVAELARMHPGAATLVPPDSTVSAVVGLMAGAELVHLACHGSVRADNPIFSSMLVSDGPLTVHELERRGIAPRRIVLAACESSSDATYPGNESLGFVSTLLAAGTGGLVASSVVVPDWNVVAMMTALHRSLRDGSTMAVALHRARATVDRTEAAGFVSWCAFDAFGAA